MKLLQGLILFSSFSFLFYGISYFKSTKMKDEFKRFGLEKLGILTAVLELLGAVGLIIGLSYQPILLIAAGGLAILMLMGLAVRIKVKDGLWLSLPALFYLLLNAYIFINSIFI